MAEHSVNKRQWIVVIATMLMVTQLASCGFTLRGIGNIPNNVDSVYVQSSVAHAPLKRALSERLKRYQIEQAYTPENIEQHSTVKIYLYPEDLERRLLSVFPSGQVAEYELIYNVRYDLEFPGQEAKLVEFDILREYQDDPDEVLAKSRELELVLSEMRTDAADRIIRLLASQATTR